MSSSDTSELSGVIRANHILKYPPAQNRYMQEKILEELIFARIHVGPVFALSRIQENTLEELCLKYVFAPLPPRAYLCMNIVAVFTHPWCQYMKIFLGN